MRLAVLSDIHGNLEALEAVLIAVDQEGADQLLFLGDLGGVRSGPGGLHPPGCGRPARSASSAITIRPWSTDGGSTR